MTCLKKASCAISQEESRFKILFKEFIFLFCNINKARIYNFDKKICLLENSRTELKGIRNTVFCIFLKGIRNTIFCKFLKGIRNTVFCIFFKGVRNTVFCIFLKVSETPYLAYFIYFSLQVNTK